MRLDKKIVELGLVKTRSKAQDLIKRGLVAVNNQIIRKPAYNVNDEEIKLLTQNVFVARSAEKLLHAIETFKIDVKDKICLDIGSSTGGFTQVLLQHGAKKVYAVDVGSEQMHQDLRNNPKVILLENTDARSLSPALVPDTVDLFVSDVSFISITKILPHITSIFRKGTEGVVLIKPQFELSADLIGKGGIVRRPELHKQAIENVKADLEANGFHFQNLAFSPITGGNGNIEFLAQIIYLYGESKVNRQLIDQTVAHAHDNLKI